MGRAYSVYVRDIALYELLKNKSKEQSYNFWAVLAGRKKDRGHIWNKYFAEMDKQKLLVDTYGEKLSYESIKSFLYISFEEYMGWGI